MKLKQAVFLLSLISTSAMGLSTSYLFQTDLRYELDGGNLLYNQSLLEVSLDQSFGANVSFSTKLRLYSYSDMSVVDSKGGIDSTAEIGLQEGYVKFENFPAPNLSLTIGKQRINIGKSDFFRHLDLVNPADYSDPLSFDGKVPSYLIKFKWLIGFDSSWVVFVGPDNQTVKLPYNSTVYATSKITTETILAGIVTHEVSLQNDFSADSSSVENMSYGTIFKTKLGKFDLLAMVISHNNPNLLPKTVSLMTNNYQGTINYQTVRETVAGIGVAGEILGLGIWGELAYKISQKFVSETIIDGVLIDSITLLYSENYFTGTLGIDYQFAKGGPYFNLEYSHGFAGEMVGDVGSGVNDYFALTVEQKLNRDKIKIAVTVGAEFDNLFKRSAGVDVLDQAALFIAPAVIITVKDNVECSLGAFWVKADHNTTFSSGGFSTLGYLTVKVKI